MRKPPFTISPYHDSKRPNLKWVVRGKVGGKWKRKFFTSEAEAKTYRHLKNTELFEHGRAHVEFPAWLRVMAQRCQEKLAAVGKTLEQATEYFLERHAVLMQSVTIEKLFDETIAAKLKTGFTAKYCKRFEWMKPKFCAAFPGKMVSEFETKELTQWVQSLEGVSNLTRNNARQNLVTLFEFGKQNGYCKDNVARAIPTFKVIETEIGIITPTEAGKLLAAADPRVLPALAIGLFAGIRVAEVARLDWSEIDLEEGFIEVKARKAKSAARRIVKIQPCLDAWLRPFAKDKGPIVSSWSHFDQLKRRSYRRAGIAEWPRNAMRHSFASYHLAQFKDASALALEMGHKTNGLIFAHYRALVRPTDAAKFWQVMPGAQPETKDIWAFKPEAFIWYRKPSLHEWKGVAHWCVWEPLHSDQRIFRTEAAALKYCEQIATTEKPQYTNYPSRGERWTVGATVYHKRHDFKSEADAQAWCDRYHADMLSKEVRFNQSPRFDNLVPMVGAVAA